MKISVHSRYLVVLVLSFFLGGCSNKKDGTAYRLYHNMTGHYNGYFNANELVDLNLMDDFESVEDEKIPNAIIEVNASIQHAKIVLAYLSQLDIFALEVFLEDLVECLGAVLGDDGVFV